MMVLRRPSVVVIWSYSAYEVSLINIKSPRAGYLALQYCILQVWNRFFQVSWSSIVTGNVLYIMCRD